MLREYAREEEEQTRTPSCPPDEWLREIANGTDSHDVDEYREHLRRCPYCMKKIGGLRRLMGDEPPDKLESLLREIQEEREI